jgi:hypothetical protein
MHCHVYSSVLKYSTGRGGLGNLKGKTANKGKKKEESNMSPTRISFNTRGSYSPSLASQVLSSQTVRVSSAMASHHLTRILQGTLSSIVASTLNSVGSRPRRSASMSSFRRLGLECYELESFCGSSKYIPSFHSFNLSLMTGFPDRIPINRKTASIRYNMGWRPHGSLLLPGHPTNSLHLTPSKLSLQQKLPTQQPSQN